MKKKNAKKVLFIILVVTMMVTGVACAGNQTPATPTPTPSTPGGGGGSTAPAETDGIDRGGILRLTVTSEGVSPLGVPWETASNDVLLMHPNLETLVNEEVDGTIVPNLAESWDIDTDKNEIVFHLRKDVKFHDGADFTSADVVFCFENLMEAAQLPGVTGVEARGDYDVALLFAQVQNNVISRLPSKTASIISKASLAQATTFL